MQDAAIKHRDILIIIAVTGLLFFPGLGTRDFWDPGEPIYGEVMRMMFEKNNWLVPMLNGEIYADKPALYFWLALIFANLAGVANEWTTRLPAALGGLGLVLVTYQFGKTFFDRGIGLFAALILATSSRMLWESRFLRLDTLLSFFLFLGFYYFIRAFLGNGSKRQYLLAYFLFGLAVLTKGPVGLVLPGLAALLLLAVSGRWRELREMHLISGTLVILATIVPWLLLLYWHGETLWLHDFIWIHNVQNYALEPIGHIRPWYYYIVNLPPDFLPWTVLLPGAVIFYHPWRQRLRDPASLGLFCWFAAVFLFFSISKSKIAYYLLPLLPALALLAGNYLGKLLAAENRTGVHWLCTLGMLYLLAAIFILSGMATPFAARKFAPTLFLWTIPLALVLIIGGAALFVTLRKQSVVGCFWSLMTLLVGAALIAALIVLPHVDDHKSARALGRFVRTRIPTSAGVYVYQSKMAVFNYYAGRERIPVVGSAAEVIRLAKQDQPAYLLIHEKDLKELAFLSATRKTVSEDRIGDRNWFIFQLAPAAR